MFKRLSDKALGLCVAVQSRRAVTRRARGLETLEWVLIGVCVVIAVFGAYALLGSTMSNWINDEVVDKIK